METPSAQMDGYPLATRRALDQRCRRPSWRGSPSLREATTARLEAIWREATMALNYLPAGKGNSAPKRPENCPYVLEQVLSESIPKEVTKPATGESGDDLFPGTAHITPVGGNIFRDLGFPPDEAERLKEESDRRISGKNDNIE